MNRVIVWLYVMNNVRICQVISKLSGIVEGMLLVSSFCLWISRFNLGVVRVEFLVAVGQFFYALLFSSSILVH